MTKEQKVIQRLKYLLFIYKDDLEDKYLPTGALFNKDFEAIETVLNMLKEKDEEIEKKDKIIDLILDKLNQGRNVFENSEIKEIVEIYEEIKSTSDLRGIELRKNCIKQYFERIAEKSSSINKIQEKN